MVTLAADVVLPKSRRRQQSFSGAVIEWQRTEGRNDLPWQNTTDPYRIWVSEIMLQQTQVSAVIPYYSRFMARFPDVKSLAEAEADDVLRHWSGLGYYSRARHLHAAAQSIANSMQGQFPRTRVDLEKLPGIGRSTAAAIAVFAFSAREAILDGNVKRVLARHFAIAGYPGEKPVQDRLWAIAERLLPKVEIGRYTQGLMDLGASICGRRPSCERCPVANTCEALIQGNVGAFPSPKPRKTNPRKSTHMILVFHQGDLLLQQRPPTGIWPGLWSCPEASSRESADLFCERDLGLEVEFTRELKRLQHQFTHFSLDIHPLIYRAGKSRPEIKESTLRWVPLSEAGDWALPAPIRKILAKLQPLSG